MAEPDFIKYPRCNCTNRIGGKPDFTIDNPGIGAHIVGYVCQWPKCGCRIIDYDNSNPRSFYRELQEQEDLSDPGLIKEIRFYLYLKKYWVGEITRHHHSDKSMFHSFDMETKDLDGNIYFLEIVSTYEDQGGFRLQTYNKNWRERLEYDRECRDGGCVHPLIIFELPHKGCLGVVCPTHYRSFKVPGLYI